MCRIPSLLGQIKNGKATCFSDVVDTEIPALQTWCRALAESPREDGTRAFLSQLDKFASSVKSHLEGLDNASSSAREMSVLRRRWQSTAGRPNRVHIGKTEVCEDTKSVVLHNSLYFSA